MLGDGRGADSLHGGGSKGFSFMGYPDSSSSSSSSSSECGGGGQCQQEASGDYDDSGNFAR